jgi:hypothetical protein
MQFNGIVQNGVLVLDEGESLPEGTRVTVVEQLPAVAPTHFELFRDIVGQASDLPSDVAQNHTHYIRGGPKQ